MPYEPKLLKRWKLPECYVGARWPDYYVFLGRHRDSDLLTESNFECALRELGGESDTVLVIEESHWAVGWIQWIGIHESDHAALAKADDMLARIKDHPALNEDDWSEREFEAQNKYWEECSLRDKIELCRDCGESIFAARAKDLGDAPETVRDRVRGIVQ